MDSKSLLGVIAGIVGLAVMILTEYFTGAKKKRDEQEKFDAEQYTFAKMAERAVERIKQETIAESHQAQNMDDRADQLLKGTLPNDKK